MLIMYRKTKAVEALADYRLLVTYENGEQRVFDVGPYMDDGVFRELREESAFKSVHVAFDTVEWANGADICPEVLYEQSAPVARKVAEERSSYT